MIQGWYAWLSVAFGALTWLVIFAVSWGYIASNYGVWAVILGWLPAMIIAGISAIIMAATWPLIYAGLIYYLTIGRFLP